MEIKTHGHHTEITDSLRIKADDGARKLADHLQRAVNVDIWFGENGVMKTVEIVLHAPKYKNMVAKAESKYHEPALTDAIAKMDAQIRRLKSAKKRQVHGVELRA